MSAYQHIIKRLFDIVMSAAGLLLLWPVILVCVLLARRDTQLPGVFSQARIGRHGKRIKVFKVRTMCAAKDVNNNITVAGDARITELGRKLRQRKLDELPQLWNVLTGDMSFVGPRPDVPGYADKLTGEQRDILQLRPGITGPATIKYRGEEAILASVKDPKAYNDNVIYPDKVNVNLEYMKNWSLIGDIRFILITVHLVAIPLELRYVQTSEAGSQKA